jgi:NTP pyrophosphatase (non-canonical NTP hydrolase)
MDELKRLQEILSAFALERDWNQFHSPKNLAMALSIEASELMELFLWKTEEESFLVKEETEGPLKEELADVFLYLLRLAAILEIDLVEASLEKIKINRERYPVHLSKGNNKKHTQLQL